MAKSSIHIQRAVEGSVGHNSREHFSYSVVFTDDGEMNECTHTVEEAYKIYRKELKERTQAYENRTGQKLQKSAVTQLSAIINLEQHHTLKDLQSIKKHLEKTFNTKVYQMAIHRDEGKLISKIDGTELYSGKDFFLNPKNKKFYFDKQFTKEIDLKDYEIVKNYHAHIEMMGLDSNGYAIRQKMNKRVLKEMQTFVAKELKMERGKENISYSQEEMKQILAVTGKKSDYESNTLFAKRFNEVAKELGIYKEKRKRKDTHIFKDVGAVREEAKREVLKEVLATKEQLKDVKKQNSTLKGQNTKLKNEKEKLKEELQKLKDESKDLRAELQLQKAEKEAYQQLDYLNKQLQEQLKTGRKSFEEAKKEIEDLREKLIKKEEDVKDALEDNKKNIRVFEEEFNLPKTGNLVKLLSWVDAKLKEFSKLLRKKDAEIKELKEEIEELKNSSDFNDFNFEDLSKISKENAQKMGVGTGIESESSLSQKTENFDPSRRSKRVGRD